MRPQLILGAFAAAAVAGAGITAWTVRPAHAGPPGPPGPAFRARFGERFAALRVLRDERTAEGARG